MSTSPNDFNARIIDEFRANGGEVGEPFANTPLLLLHHAGAKSGIERVNPLAYLRDGNRYVIFASKAGAPTNPTGTTISGRIRRSGSRWGRTRSTRSPARRRATSASGCTTPRPSARRRLPTTSAKPRAPFRSSCSRRAADRARQASATVARASAERRPSGERHRRPGLGRAARGLEDPERRDGIGGSTGGGPPVRSASASSA